MQDAYDVVVVGAGNAALCAALSSAETGASVVVLERAPHAERGGNTTFTAGAMRFAYSGVEEILELCPELTDEQVADILSYVRTRMTHGGKTISAEEVRMVRSELGVK